MNSEFKKVKKYNETRYILETATAGATSSASVATVPGSVGEVQKRIMDSHDDHEISMAKSDLHHIIQQAVRLKKILARMSEQEGLEGWQQAKITKAADYINSVFKNLNYEHSFFEDDKSEKEKLIKQLLNMDPTLERNYLELATVDELKSIMHEGVAEGFMDKVKSMIKPKPEIEMEIDGRGNELWVRLSKAHDSVGNFNFRRSGKDNKDLEALDIWVDAKHRGQRLAKQVYDTLKQRGFKIHRSSEQTPDGKKFWDKNRPDTAAGAVWEQGVAEGSYTTEKQILTRIRQIMYDRKLSGTESNAGELLRLKQQLKDLRSQQGVAEDSYSISDFKINAYESMADFRKWMRSPKKNDRGMTRRIVDIYENIVVKDDILKEASQTFVKRKQQAKEFSENFKRFDERDKIRIKTGNKIALLSSTIIPDDTSSRIELSGFTTPKKIVKINLDNEGKIDSIKFDDGSTFPETSEFTTVGGINITNTIFFPDGKSASKAYTAIWMLVSNLEGQGWNVEHYINESVAEDTIYEIGYSDNLGKLNLAYYETADLDNISTAELIRVHPAIEDWILSPEFRSLDSEEQAKQTAALNKIRNRVAKVMDRPDFKDELNNWIDSEFKHAVETQNVGLLKKFIERTETYKAQIADAIKQAREKHGIDSGTKVTYNQMMPVLRDIMSKKGVAEAVSSTAATLMYAATRKRDPQRQSPEHNIRVGDTVKTSDGKSGTVVFVNGETVHVKGTNPYYPDRITHYTAGELKKGVAEEKQKGVDGKACWKGYKRMGTKKKGGKTVDNCVKMGEDTYVENLTNMLEQFKKKLTIADPLDVWIDRFTSETDLERYPQFRGKTARKREAMAKSARRDAVQK
jgi:hypothetical protein